MVLLEIGYETGIYVLVSYKGYRRDSYSINHLTYKSLNRLDILSASYISILTVYSE
jgi:hypothetical protein